VNLEARMRDAKKARLGHRRGVESGGDGCFRPFTESVGGMSVVEGISWVASDDSVSGSGRGCTMI
jgi:hypothetical protein